MENNTPSINAHTVKETEIDLGTILSILKAHKWLLCIAACVGLIIGFFITKVITPQYEATALVQVDDSISSSSVLGGMAGFGLLRKASPSQIQSALITSSFVPDPLVKSKHSISRRHQIIFPTLDIC